MDMEKKSGKKKTAVIIAIVIAIVLVAVGAGVAVWQWRDKDSDNGKNTPAQSDEEKGFTFYHGEVKDLGSPDDVGVMIADCDDASYFKTLTNATVTRKAGKYVQGKGALEISSMTATATAEATFEDVNVSAYEKGSVHMSVYLSNTKYMTGPLYVELSSSGEFDVDEFNWIIPESALHAGWNDLYLGFEDAILTGTPDMTKLNYFRIFTLNAKVGLDGIVDAIYATNTPGMSLAVNASNVETASTKPGYLLDFDTLKGISSAGTMTLSTAAAEHKEGKAGLLIQNINQNDNYWFRANIEPFDLTKYSGGKITFPIYISDAAHVAGATICLELSSSGTWDKNELHWVIDGSTLKTGWNEVQLLIDSGIPTEDGVDMKNINFIRIWALDYHQDLYLIMDAVRAQGSQTRVPADGMFLNCDTEQGFKIDTLENKFSVTNADGEYKEGTGAYKSVGSDIVWWRIISTDLVDLSKYAGGGVHLWLYVSDVSKIKEPVTIEIGSGGIEDVDEYQWMVGGLKNGFNELNLDFESAMITGNPDLKAINFFRVWGERTGSITTILDDVRATDIDKKVQIPGMILSCDDYDNVQNLFGEGTITVTVEDGEYKEGIGAYKSVGNGQIILRAILTNPVDVSGYKDGSLAFWLYIDDVAKWNGRLGVELNSSGADDADEVQWLVSGLKNGWNEIKLNFADAEMTGNFDYRTVRYFRIFQHGGNAESNMTVILDNVHASQETVDNGGDDDGEDDEPVIEGMIISGDSLKNMTVGGNAISITKTDGEYKQGSGAIKSVGSGIIWLQAALKKPADISAFEGQGVHMWLYISDATKLAGEAVVEIGDAGREDVSEYQWHLALGSLKEGWQELYLDLASAEVIGSGVDLSRINWFRIYGELAGDVTILIDDVRAENGKPDDGEKEERTVIHNCDGTENITNIFGESGVTLATAAGEFAEGTGAFKNAGFGQIRYHIVLTNPVDISKHQAGTLQFYLYVGNKLQFTSTDMTVEISSSGNADVNELSWNILLSDLKEGWNKLVLNIADGAPQGGAIDLAKVNFFRLYLNTSETSQDVVLILDDICAVGTGTSSGEEKNEIPVLSCDNSGDVLEGAVVTNAEGEFQEGTGAYKNTSGGTVQYQFTLAKPVDISTCANGYFEFKFYINDLEKWMGSLLVVNLSSDGNWNREACQWVVDKSTLQNGWNVISLPLAQPQDGTSYGPIDLTSFNYLRIWQVGGDSATGLVTMLDDVRARKQ